MQRSKCVEKGFTLIELVIVLAILGIIAVIGMPALINAIRRAETEGGVRQATVELRAARLEAVKHSATVYVEADFANDQLVTWRENNLTAGFSANDEQVRRMPLPARLFFWGPDDAAPEGPDATFPLSSPVLTFLPNGSIDQESAIRFSDKNNYLEIRVAPRATARVAIRKHDGTDWREQGENDQRWAWQ